MTDTIIMLESIRLDSIAILSRKNISDELREQHQKTLAEAETLLEHLQNGEISKEELSRLDEIKRERDEYEKKRIERAERWCEAYCEDDEDEEPYTSSTNGDYGPGNPWDAPGMSIRDFI